MSSPSWVHWSGSRRRPTSTTPSGSCGAPVPPVSGSSGFCMGGLQAYRAAVSSSGCDAAVGFYGARIAAEGGKPRCPTLLLFGANDQYIPTADIETATARHAGTVVYPGVGHG